MSASMCLSDCEHEICEIACSKVQFILPALTLGSCSVHGGILANGH